MFAQPTCRAQPGLDILDKHRQPQGMGVVQANLMSETSSSVQHLLWRVRPFQIDALSFPAMGKAGVFIAWFQAVR